MSSVKQIVKQITQLHQHTIPIWENQTAPLSQFTHDDAILSLIGQQHQTNFLLWHQEDKARNPKANDSQIAQVKRKIDKLNQKRNDLIYQIDVSLNKVVFNTPENNELAWNSETVGSIIDRLSIGSLKCHYMKIQSERETASESHREQCRLNHQQLVQQHADLSTALQKLIDDIQQGKKQNKLYHPFKMYNDAQLNPEIYS